MAISTLPKSRACILFITLVLFPACAGQKMSVEEAKKISVKMSEKAFIPPPRRIDDNLAILDESDQFGNEAAAKIEIKRIAGEILLPFIFDHLNGVINIFLADFKHKKIITIFI